MIKSSLSAAYHGYNHQDAVTAYALASMLLPRSGVGRVLAERKSSEGDTFDDLELSGDVRRRVQIKAHQGDTRHLRLRDFTSRSIRFRIDDAISSVVEDDESMVEYRLFTTFGSPSEDLLPFVREDRSVPALLPGLDTRCFKLDLTRIWPHGEGARWPHIEGLGRTIVQSFCNQFVVEIGCPQSSGDLRHPGAMEGALCDLLHDGVGVGSWPNHNRDLADAAAHLIHTAKVAREKGASLNQVDIINALALRVDYGRVEERLGVDERRLVPRRDVLNLVVDLLGQNQRVAVVGSPGIGKSWLLHQLSAHLVESGWVVGTHYCFLDPYDSERARRASIEATFGSIMAELIDNDPSLVVEGIPRFAAGPRELQQLLDSGMAQKPDRRIAIIVDGLDHIDRLPDRLSAATAASLVEELASIRLPPGVALVIGSQPGRHLTSFLAAGEQIKLQEWPTATLRTLAERENVVQTLRVVGLEQQAERVLETIVDKADGNPLYATYLSRSAVGIATKSTEAPPEGDIADYLSGVPELDEGLDAYYEWLLQSISQDTGRRWIAELLALIGFPVSEEELGAIRPEFRHHIGTVLSHLAPVLEVDISRGGIRIYHESFQRYVREKVEGEPGADIEAILAPVIRWLEDRGFCSDTRSFRFLIELLQRAHRDEEVAGLIQEDFVSVAATHCQPADAVQANLAAAAASASRFQDWRVLARLSELSRAADYLYQWRLDDHTLAEAYGRTYAELYGAEALADRLLYHGRCTFPARPGLILCQLCDEQGAIAPWTEYLRAHELQMQSDNTSYGADSDSAINAARLNGRFRLEGRSQSIGDFIEWLQISKDLPLHPADMALILGEMYGDESLLRVAEALPPGVGRAWVNYALMILQDVKSKARSYAKRAISDGLPRDGWIACLRAGLDTSTFKSESSRIEELTGSILSGRGRFEENVLIDWLTEIRLGLAEGDEAGLLRVESLIPSDSWFHKWLRFCVLLAHPGSKPEQIITSLVELSREINVFEGDPRVVDLYGFRNEIRGSFREALSGLGEEDWNAAIDALKTISRETTTWLQGSRSGPLPVDVLLELALATADTDAKHLAVSALGSELLSPDRRGGELYDTHAQDALLLSRVHWSADKRALAENCWLEACRYLAGYGWRKDITVYELLDPIPKLNAVSPIRARQCLADVQRIVEGVLVHTDGKETSHAIHQWLDLAADIHPAGALAFLARSSVCRMPDFGGFDHALPRALAALMERIEQVASAAGWVAAGFEVRNQPEAAVAACEAAFVSNPRACSAVWFAVIASLDGDGVEPPAELRDLVEASAHRLGLSTPSIRKVSVPSENGTRIRPLAPSRSFLGISHTLPSLLPVDASPLQIIHGVRQWYDWRGTRPRFEDAANAVGWRLMELVQKGDRDTAETIIHRIARDTPRWDSNRLLPAIAEGLWLRGEARLAALTYAYSYTRSRDGWRRFGGGEAESFFIKAAQLDGHVAMSTLAQEVSDSIAIGGEYGVTVHMIELLAALGRAEDAFAAWDAACGVVTFRMPTTGPGDEIDNPYSQGTEDASGALAEAIVARMNHYLLQERRNAVAGAALLAAHRPKTLAVGLRLAASKSAPLSTLIALLQVLHDYEPEPYEATRAAVRELTDVSGSEFVSARVLARRLLERAGIDAAVAPPLDEPALPRLSDERLSEIMRGVGRARIEPIAELWPEFGEIVAARVDHSLTSDELRDSMRRATRKLVPYRRGRYLSVWLPVDEEIDRILQRTGASIRVALAQRGILNPEMEDWAGLRLLGNLEIGVRLVFSRIVRPEYTPVPSTLPSGLSVSEVVTVPDGDLEGWVIAGCRETELAVGDDYDKAVKAQIEVYSGLVFAGDWYDDGGLPFGYGRHVVWHRRSAAGSAVGTFHGPFAGIDILRDPFGDVEVLAPHTSVSSNNDLNPSDFESGLTLLDNKGRPAVVCKTWRQRLIGDEYLPDRVHRLKGMHLLIRPDVFELTEDLASEPARHVTVVTTKREEDLKIASGAQL